MTVDIAIVLVLFALAVVFFAMEWLPVDTITLCLVVGLVVSGVLTPEEAFSGFASDMVIVLASVFVLSGAMVKSGVIEGLGDLIHRFGGAAGRRGAGILMGVSAASSAFLSNTVATAVLMPPVMENARKSRTSPSRLLMPVAYASILGGTCTLIGTSTNIAGSAMTARLGLEPFSMFEFAGIGVIMALAGILWLVLLGSRLIPERVPAEPPLDHSGHEYLSALSVPEDAKAVDRNVGALGLDDLGVSLLSVLRDGQRLQPHHRRKIRAGDEMIVRAPRDNLLKARDALGLRIAPSRHLDEEERKSDDLAMAEAVLLPQSALIGRTLKQLNFHGRYGATVSAIHRPGHARPARIENLRLKVGDVLLLQGPRDRLERLRGNPNLWGLVEVDHRVLMPRHGLLVLGLIGLALLLSVTGVVALAIGLLSGAMILTVLKVITTEDAYRFIDWRLIVLIAGLTSFGGAMIKTGAAGLIADQIVALTLPLGTTASMAAFAVLTIALTQPMSNAAAALTVLPVAVASAPALGVEPRSLAILVTLSASLSFITPLEPACLLVYGPGRYKFHDFIRAGLPLTAICLALLLVLVPVFWPL